MQLSTEIPIRIVPAPGSGLPIFVIPEGDGPLEVCVEIQNPFVQDHLEKTVVATLSTAVGTALSKSGHFFYCYLHVPKLTTGIH